MRSDMIRFAAAGSAHDPMCGYAGWLERDGRRRLPGALSFHAPRCDWSRREPALEEVTESRTDLLPAQHKTSQLSFQSPGYDPSWRLAARHTLRLSELGEAVRKRALLGTVPAR